MADIVPAVAQGEILSPQPSRAASGAGLRLPALDGGVASVFNQPAVRKSLPLLLALMLLVGAAFAWSMVRTPPQKLLFAGLEDADKQAISESLGQAGIASRIDSGSGALTVAEGDYYRARMLLASQNLPKAAPGGYAILDQLPLGVSRAVEGERLRQARESEIARSIQEIDAVTEARVHLATPESSVFVRDSAAPSASVVVKLAAGRSLSDAQVRSIINLVASSVPGMKPDAVTVVDQNGNLLTQRDSDPTVAASDQRIAFQRKVESKYREQLAQLMTPLVGAGNYTAEVQADVNLDESQATSENYNKDGTVMASEQGAWTSAPGPAAEPAQGIPGALSNTPPPATQVAAEPNGVMTPAIPGAAPTGAPADPTGAGIPKQSESYARNYEVGRQISVTRQAPGEVRRLSVAVVVRELDGAKKRTPAEIEQLTNVVRAAVGFNEARGDQVAVMSRPFAGAETTESAGQPWYEAGWVAMLARNLTALAVAAIVVFGAVRPLVKSVVKRRDKATAEATTAAHQDAAIGLPGPAAAALQPGSGATALEMLDGARGYDDRVQAVRSFTRDNPERAALAVRDMMRADVAKEAAR